LHGLGRTAVPRRTRSSTQTTAIRPPLKRTARTEETPTLPLTPIEVDSIVQGAEASSVLHADAPTRPTIEIFRPALGSAPIPTVEQAAIVLPVTPDVASAAIGAPAKPDIAAAALAVASTALVPVAELAAASAALVPVAELAAASAALVVSADAAAIAPAAAPADASAATAVRGQRRTREMFHRDAVRPPSRKR
jgi:hypothetical protein